LVFAAVACGGTSAGPIPGTTDSRSDSGTGNGSGTGNDGSSSAASGGSRAPKLHRPSPIACSHDRAAGDAVAEIQSASCYQDTACTTGANGRCLVSKYAERTNSCSYDTCYADVDCGPLQVCSCRTPGENAPNVCLNTGNCVVDADCGAGAYCSHSQQFANTFFDDAYYCHTATDTCLDDSDCANTGPHVCAYDPSSHHWACAAFGGSPP
jgi:hypothetical protein